MLTALSVNQQQLSRINSLSLLIARSVITAEKLKNKLPYMRKTLQVVREPYLSPGLLYGSLSEQEPQSCKPVYLFLFNFAKEPTKKHLSLDDCLAYWDLLLKWAN